MNTKSKDPHKPVIFQNIAKDFESFHGQLIPSEHIDQYDLSDLKVAIIGADQATVSKLENICQKAQFVKVFQITPHFILPKTQSHIHKLISHPLIIKNRRLFNNRIKSLLAIRHLEAQVKETWLRRQLTPNTGAENKKFFKSDNYYIALQRDNCKLITWPVVRINADSIQSMEGVEHLIDVIITTYV
ncbi:flavoprotein [Acinetobacter radioresistens]|uniref:flavoprotein n=1 Tax=Acinetobacter radioresistens TaxID=40216 RepID=UPI00321539BF